MDFNFKKEFDRYEEIDYQAFLRAGVPHLLIKDLKALKESELDIPFSKGMKIYQSLSNFTTISKLLLSSNPEEYANRHYAPEESNDELVNALRGQLMRTKDSADSGIGESIHKIDSKYLACGLNPKILQLAKKFDAAQVAAGKEGRAERDISFNVAKAALENADTADEAKFFKTLSIKSDDSKEVASKWQEYMLQRLKKADSTQEKCEYAEKAGYFEAVATGDDSDLMVNLLTFRIFANHDLIKGKKDLEKSQEKALLDIDFDPMNIVTIKLAMLGISKDFLQDIPADQLLENVTLYLKNYIETQIILLCDKLDIEFNEDILRMNIHNQFNTYRKYHTELNEKKEESTPDLAQDLLTIKDQVALDTEKKVAPLGADADSSSE